MSHDLLNALRTTYEVNAHVPSQRAIEQTVNTAADYFIGKNTTPTIRRWGIVCVDLPTNGSLLYNVHTTRYQKSFTLITLPALEPYTFDDVLWIIESDKWTPHYIFDMARAHTAGGLQGQILNLVRTPSTG